MAALMNDMLPLIEPLIPALRRYARALLRDRAAADDLVQDCLERAITRWHQRREDGDSKAWMFRVLHNLAINRLRQAQRRGSHVAIEDAGDHLLSRPPSQEAALRHRDLLHALEALPEDQRAVLLLVSVEDVPYAEAARILDVPIGTVMSRLSRARERLRHLMEHGTGETAPGGPNLRRVK
jgi:RNA polymerase sigma factor (sigma-70 family)